MRTLFLDMMSGVCGDMIVGALLDAGAPMDLLQDALATVQLPVISIRQEVVQRNAISARRFIVECPDMVRTPHLHRTPTMVQAIIRESGIPEGAKSHASAVYERLALAEARIHRQPVNEVEFHEVGSAVAILNVLAGCICIDSFHPDAVYSTHVMIGCGCTITTSHGVLPAPAPATLELLKHHPVKWYPEHSELTTPTGAAMVTHFSQGLLPAACEMTVTSVGYGAGKRELPGLPNVLRAVLGE